MVDTSNIDQLKVGNLGEAWQIADDGAVRIPIRVDSPRGLAAVAGGKTELSMGYDLDLETAPAGSMYQGKLYTHRQRNIRYNHIAITDKARLGPQMRLDSADSVEGDADSSNPQKEPDMLMKKVNIDSVEYEVPAQVAVAIGKLETRAADADEAKTEAEKALEDEKKEKAKGMDALQAKHDAAVADKKKAEDSLAALEKDIPARAAAIAKDTADLMSVAKAAMPAAEFAKLKGMDSSKIKLAVIGAKYPKHNMDGKSADYINATFDGIREGLKGAGTSALEKNRLDAAEFNEDGEETLVTTNLDAARDKMLARNKVAYLNPSPYATRPAK